MTQVLTLLLDLFSEDVGMLILKQKLKYLWIQNCLHKIWEQVLQCASPKLSF